MEYEIRNIRTLKKLLFLDFFLGCSTAVVGLVFFEVLATFLGLTIDLIVAISAITLLYAIVAFRLTLQKDTSIPLLKTLINANWIWVVISIVLSFFHFEKATSFGQIFLILQILVVGGLAYFEGGQIIRNPV